MSSLASPGFYAKIERILSIPETIGEVTLLFWFMIKGISLKKIKNGTGT
jgi:hypothetical protein